MPSGGIAVGGKDAAARDVCISLLSARLRSKESPASPFVGPIEPEDEDAGDFTSGVDEDDLDSDDLDTDRVVSADAARPTQAAASSAAAGA